MKIIDRLVTVSTLMLISVLSFYTDDQGAIDLNCFGANDLVTPNMDKLVKSGIKFTQFYGAPVCSPSRAGLLT